MKKPYQGKKDIWIIWVVALIFLSGAFYRELGVWLIPKVWFFIDFMEAKYKQTEFMCSVLLGLILSWYGMMRVYWWWEERRAGSAQHKPAR